jgi:hypothetical protein
MEMRPNKTNGSPGRTYKFLDTNANSTTGCTDCVSFPFGHGESYTSFSMAWSAPPSSIVNAGDSTLYELTLTNTGGMVGDVRCSHF